MQRVAGEKQPKKGKKEREREISNKLYLKKLFTILLLAFATFSCTETIEPEPIPEATQSLPIAKYSVALQ